MVRILKQITTTTLLGMSLVFALSGCALFKTGNTNISTKSSTSTAKSTQGAPASEGAIETHHQNAANPDALVIERVPFELGVSSFTVERIAKQNNCQPKKGAGLLYRKNPVEVYRVECEDGRELKARCELRQCDIFKP